MTRKKELKAEIDHLTWERDNLSEYIKSNVEFYKDWTDNTSKTIRQTVKLIEVLSGQYCISPALYRKAWSIENPRWRSGDEEFGRYFARRYAKDLEDTANGTATDEAKKRLGLQ